MAKTPKEEFEYLFNFDRVDGEWVNMTEKEKNTLRNKLGWTDPSQEQKVPFEDFSAKGTHFRDEVIRVGEYLMEPDQVANGLAVLNGEMVEALRTANLCEAITFYDTRRAAYDKTKSSGKEEKKTEYRKLLVNVLKKWETRGGFQHDGSDKVKVFLKLLPNETFVEQSEKRAHFKDLVDPKHGDLSHRIQWYLVSRFVELRRKPNELVNLFVDCNTIRLKDGLLWDYLFERNQDREPYIQNTEEDCRRAEGLNHFIMNDKRSKQWPLLAAYLGARNAKRQALTSNAEQQKDYLARKLYQVSSYKELEKDPEKWKKFNETQ
jgi:hypothetical protein